MANIKISELTALTPPAAADELPVVDVSATSTKKTTVGEIVGIINGDVEVASNGTATISELPVSKLQDGAARQVLQTAANGTDVEWTSNVDLPGTLDVTGVATFDAAVNVAGLASLDGGIDVDGAFTVANSSGNIATSGTLGVSGQSTLASAAISDLTSGRVVLAGNSGEIQDSANLTFSGTQLDVGGDVVITGDLTVQGANTTLETQTVTVEDKNIELGVVATPTNTTADGGGITLRGATSKTWNWVNSTSSWTSSEHVDLTSGKVYKINGTEVLSATALAATVKITSDNITDGTIVDADINANAEIAVSKLADGSARQLLQTAANGTDVEWASNIDIPGTLDVTGNAVFDANLTVQGDLTVNGTETIINTQTLTVEDKNIELGKITSPTDVTADGGGITLKGTTDKTINWVDATDAWTFSEHVDLASAKEYRIAGTKVLDATSLGSGVVSSSLTSVGTIGTGAWQGTAIADNYLETISTAGKVSNSATTADSANTASAIVARDGSGNFTAGTITADLTGNADTATALETARTIGGVSFDGTANINLPGVNTAGNQDTTGNAATVTTNADLTGDVTSVGNATSIAAGAIVDADVNASAAIAGTKINPDFGSQTIATTGVFSHALGAAATPSVTFTGDLNTGIYSPGADQVAISTNGTGQLFVDASGNVGVGATATGFSSGDGVYIYRENTANLRIFSNANGKALELSSSSVGATIDSRGAGGAIVFSQTGSEKARITSDGKLGLGTSSPIENFQIQSGDERKALFTNTDFVNTTTGTSLDVAFGATTGNTFVHLRALNSGRSVWGNLIVQGGGGRVGIGTTSPATTLDVNGDVTITDKIIHGGDTNTAIRFPAADTVSVETGGSERARIDSSGRLGLGVSSPTSLLHLADAGNIQVGTTTGTKIGTATTQKLGFYNATPVVQPAAVADATTAVDVITQLNDLLAKLRTLGIIAT
jgi:hypothetical protein